MMKPWNPQANEIFLSAVSIPDPTERMQYVETSCAENEPLKWHVHSMLQTYQAAGRFLEDVPEAGAGIDDSQQHTDDHPQLPLFFQPGQLFANHFVIREILGWGGMGIVALADQTQPIARRVAIKIIRPESQMPGMFARFEQERRVLALMQHPHIARVLQAGYVDTSSGVAVDVAANDVVSAHPYLIMELIDGQPINTFCDQNRQIVAQRIKLMISICSAVQHAHSKGIMHRDLKPSNLLIETVDGNPVPKIIDFGIAKLLEWDGREQSLHTSDHQIVGTIDYMSPEQAQFAGDIDTRTDVYSLGAVLYELLTGSVPLERDQKTKNDLLESMRRIHELDPPRPSVRVNGLSNARDMAALRCTTHRQLTGLLRGDLDWILIRALEKDRERRYQTASQFADDLQRFLDNETVAARPPALGYRLQKTWHRHRFACIASAAMLLLLVAGIIGTSVGFYRSTQNAQRAESGQHRIGELLAESYLDAAHTAVSRGQWTEALENLDRIERASTVDLIDAQLLRLNAWNGQNHMDEVRKTLEALEYEPASDSQRAQIRLWQADIALFDGAADRHQSLVSEAMELPLPDDDRQYALALAATTTPEAIDRLQQALTFNPFHHRAHQSLPLLLVSLGKFDDARSQIRMADKLFPLDPIFVATESVILTLEGKFDDARDWLEQNSGMMTATQQQQFDALLENLDQLQESMNQAIESPSLQFDRIDISSYSSSRAAIHEIIQTHSLRVPLVLQENLMASVHAIGTTFPGKRYEEAIATIRDVSARHPDGLLFYLSGSMLSVNRNWTAAEQAFELAVKFPSCFASVKPKALQGLIMTRCAIYLRDRESITKRQKAELKTLIAQRLANPDPTSLELGQLSKAAMLAKDLNLARSIIQKAIDADPNSLQLNVFQAQIEFEAGNLAAAHAAADHALKLAAQPQFGLSISKQFRRMVSTANEIRDQSAHRKTGSNE